MIRRNGDNVQILERLVGECKRQMIILTEEGSTKLQKCGNQAERESAGKKWPVVLNAVWETIHGQITEGVQEMGIHIDQDVRSKLNGMCEMLRVVIGGQLANFQGKKQELEQ